MSFKNKLQEFCHINKLSPPVYTVINLNQKFKSIVNINEMSTESDFFTTIKQADQHAAELLYNNLLKSTQISININNQPLILIDGNHCSSIAMQIQKYIVNLDYNNVYIFVHKNYTPPRGMLFKNIVRSMTDVQNASITNLIFQARLLYNNHSKIILISKNEMIEELKYLLCAESNIQSIFCSDYKTLIDNLKD